MKTTRTLIHICVLLLIALSFLSGCAGKVKNMRAVPPGQAVDTPQSGKSMVVFLRPSVVGSADQSSVFEIVKDQPSLVGLVAAKKKVAYQTEPGEHLFMVVSESADFMSADLEANKTYYALVTPRMGLWKTRFSLRPIDSGEINTEKFDKWLNSCEWVGKTPESDRWAADNMADIQDKHREYYQKWMSKDNTDRPNLFPQDGK